MDPTVRKDKTADKLVPGDWLAPGELLDGAAEVLFALTYPASADSSRDNSGTHVQLVIREQAAVTPYTDIVPGGWLAALASEADLAERKAAAERAARIAEIRAFADFLEKQPTLPMSYVRMQVSINPHGDVWNSGAEGIAEVRRVAELIGEKVSTGDDRTEVEKQFGRSEYCLIAWHKDGRPAEPEPEPLDPTQYANAADLNRELGITGYAASVPASEDARLTDPTGLAYARTDGDEPDDPTPVSPGRVPLHTGGMTDGGLVDETPEQSAEIVDANLRTMGSAGLEPVAEHYEARGWKGDGRGECGVECACGEATFDGFDSLYEAKVQLSFHIEAATSPTGLTKAADESRGLLAFTTPVVTYFSFGHGQSDPDTGQSLLSHYVTVVAPTYEACRTAMFASRFGNKWSFDYLAGTARATKWIPRWTEHEVIVAPGTDEVLAEVALDAARQVLTGEDERCPDCGESLREIRLGTLGHIPGAICAPADDLPEADTERPLISDATIAEAAAMEDRDRAAGGSPWEVPNHPDNALPGGWHHGQIR